MRMRVPHSTPTPTHINGDRVSHASRFTSRATEFHGRNLNTARHFAVTWRHFALSGMIGEIWNQFLCDFPIW